MRTASDKRRLNWSGSARDASLPWKRECPAAKAVSKGEELAPEHAAEDADRQEETRTIGHPAGAVGRQAATRHDAMDVGVVLEVLAPGVEDGQEADLGPEVLGVGGDLAGSRRRLGTAGRRLPGVWQGDRIENRREGEDDVEVVHMEQLGCPSLHPAAAAVAWHLGQWRLRHEL